MLSAVVLVAMMAGSCLSIRLPEVMVSFEDGVLEFSMPHVQKIKHVEFQYQLGHLAKSVLPKTARAMKAADGRWQVRDDKVEMKPGDSVQFNVVAWGKSRKVQGPTTQWVYAPTAVHGPRRLRGAVMFRDDFNRLDTSNWRYEVSMYGGMNWEFQVYTPESYNVFTRSGNLYLKPTKTTDDPRWDDNYLYSGVMDPAQIWGYCTQSAQYGCHREGRNGILPPVMSGKLKSVPTLRYGYVEVRARIPKGDWLWPAIWMLPRDNHYGGWPRSGEIDIMESRGNVNANGHGVNEVSSTLHWGTSPGDNHYGQTTGARHTGDWSAGFHTWKLEWTYDHLATYVDNQQIMRVTPPAGGFSQLGHTSNIWAGNDKMAPFDKEFYMIFNVAVGGTNGFFPDGWNYGYAKPWSNSSPHAAKDFWQNRARWEHSWVGDNVAMEIDYIEMRYL
ncbi:beta-1,3-glucan-binding protein-like [Babylonia areolata]|uniref:beta-1,3-glucan-binding protein-like n=1 Tax=Babylonia areolata TaxID=304850 RepID=UPI003FD43719